MTRNYVTLTDQFERYEIDGRNFPHMDHVGVGYEILKRYGFLDAVAKYSDVLITLTKRLGAERKFNVTITVAFLSIIAERMLQNDYLDAHDFMDKNPDLIHENPVAKLYSKERLASEEARLHFVMPDLTQ